MSISYHCYFMIQVILAAWVSVLLAASAVIVNTVFHFLFRSVPLVILASHMSTTIVPTVIVPASFFPFLHMGCCSQFAFFQHCSGLSSQSRQETRHRRTRRPPRHRCCHRSSDCRHSP